MPPRDVIGRPASALVPRTRATWLAFTAVAVIVLVQAWAYYSVLPLSLGPRVIMQPWLMNQPGFLAYEQIADQHTPLMPLVISWFVPVAPDGWHLARVFLVALLSATTLLTWWGGRRVSGPLGGLIAAAFFVCWTGPFGYAKLWHESFLAPLYAALLILFRPPGPARSPMSLAGAGAICGVALLAKQHAAAVLLAFIFWNLITGWLARRPWRELAASASLVSLSAAVPVTLYGMWHWWRAGTLANLWFWTVKFSFVSGYASLARQPATPADVWQVGPAFLIVLVALFGLIRHVRHGDPSWQPLGWALVLLAASGLTVYPRFEAFHLQASLPALGYLCASTLVPVRKTTGPRGRGLLVGVGPAAVAVTIGVTSIVALAGTCRSAVFPAGARVTHEYSDLEPLAAGIRRVIDSTGELCVFPDDEATANIYYLLRRPPRRFWVFTYPWYMIPPVRERILRTLGDAPPRWVVHPVGRWGVDRFAPDILAYLRDNYVARARLRWEQGTIEVLERR